MTKKFDEIFDFSNVLIHIVKMPDIQLADVCFNAGFEDVGVGEYDAC